MRVGNIEISPLRDGWFVPPPGYFGEGAHPEQHQGLRDQSGSARLPVGCFLLRTPSQSLPIDRGVGQLPAATVEELAREGYRFVGGELESGATWRPVPLPRPRVRAGHPRDGRPNLEPALQC